MVNEPEHFTECPAGHEEEPGDCICREIAEDIDADRLHDEMKEEGSW